MVADNPKGVLNIDISPNGAKIFGRRRRGLSEEEKAFPIDLKVQLSLSSSVNQHGAEAVADIFTSGTASNSALDESSDKLDKLSKSSSGAFKVEGFFGNGMFGVQAANIDALNQVLDHFEKDGFTFSAPREALVGAAESILADHEKAVSKYESQKGSHIAGLVDKGRGGQRNERN